MSIAGGVDIIAARRQKVECDAIQIFTRSSRQWAAHPLQQDEIALFKRNRKETGIGTVVAHDSYLLNLGTPDTSLRKKSIAAFIDELERLRTLGVSASSPIPARTWGGRARGH
jgi:deoxyribonuclease-4